jgi:DNA-binding CsgD family transcriptional regulator
MRSLGNFIEKSQMSSCIKQNCYNRNLLVGYKNKNICLQETNQTTASLFNFKYSEDMHGLNDYEIGGPSTILIPCYVAQDQKVFEGNKLIILDIMPCRNETFLGTTTRLPVVDDNLNIVGSSYFMTKKTGSNDLFLLLQKIMRKENKSGLSLILDEQNVIMDSGLYPSLSKKELNVLWLLARGMTARKIAAFLSRSPRTIEDHIDNIKIKYNCTNKSELIEKAIHMGILNYLPFELINAKTTEII